MLILTLCDVFLPGCSPKAREPEVIRREGYSPIVNVANADPEMEAAIQKAHSTLPEFIQAMQNPPANDTDFVIKAAFWEGRQSEHMWVSQLAYQDGVFRGVLDNQPYYIKNVKAGDTVSVQEKDISDWFYYQNGKRIGGYSLALLLKREKEAREKGGK